MRRLRTAIVGAIEILGLALWVMPSAHAVLQYTDRSKVNVLNSDTVSVTANLGVGLAPKLIGFSDGEWDTAGNSGNGILTVNFNATRNIKKVMFSQYNYTQNYSITNATVESSDDGGIWTARSSSTARDGTVAVVTLDNAVDAKYLRVTGTTYDRADKRWIVDHMRVLGDTGTLPLDPHLDLVSSTALSGGVTLTTFGSQSLVGSLANIVDDAQYPISRNLMWQMDTGEGFILDFSATAASLQFNKFGLMLCSGFFAAANTFTLETWDGAAWTTPQSFGGALVTNQNFFNLTPMVGTKLRFTWTSASGNRVSDLFVFGQEAIVPEPATVLLLGLAGLFVAPRRRRGT